MDPLGHDLEARLRASARATSPTAKTGPLTLPVAPSRRDPGRRLSDAWGSRGTLRLTYAPWGETLAELVEASRAAEAAGAEVVWAPEMHRSATVTAAAMAAGTRTVGVGTAIALAFTRSPMVTALEAMDLDEMAGGRFVLGLGTGVQRVNEDWHNAQWGKPRRATCARPSRSSGTFVATLHDGEPMTSRASTSTCGSRATSAPTTASAPTIPIYLAGMGPVMIRLAGEIGDGLDQPRAVLAALRHASQVLPVDRRGPRARGQATARTSTSSCRRAAAVDDDGRAGAPRWRPASSASTPRVRTYADFFDFHGFADEQQPCIAAFKAGRHRAEARRPRARRHGRRVHRLGTPDEVRDRLRAYDGRRRRGQAQPADHGLAPDQTRGAAQLLASSPSSTED